MVRQVIMAAQEMLPDDQILRWLVVGTQQISNSETVSSAGLHLAEHVTAVVGASPPLHSCCSQLFFFRMKTPLSFARNRQSPCLHESGHRDMEGRSSPTMHAGTADDIMQT